jgi:hypothetical protein
VQWSVAVMRVGLVLCVCFVAGRTFTVRMFCCESDLYCAYVLLRVGPVLCVCFVAGRTFTVRMFCCGSDLYCAYVLLRVGPLLCVCFVAGRTCTVRMFCCGSDLYCAYVLLPELHEEHFRYLLPTLEVSPRVAGGRAGDLKRTFGLNCVHKQSCRRLT